MPLPRRCVKLALDGLGITNIRVSLGSYAIVGAAASLGGATRMTISIVILVMETSGALELLVPIMMAAWVAKMVGDSFGLGIYDTQIELRGVPLLVSRGLLFSNSLKMVSKWAGTGVGRRFFFLIDWVQTLRCWSGGREAQHSVVVVNADADKITLTFVSSWVDWCCRVGAYLLQDQTTLTLVSNRANCCIASANASMDFSDHWYCESDRLIVPRFDTKVSVF